MWNFELLEVIDNKEDFMYVAVAKLFYNISEIGLVFVLLARACFECLCNFYCICKHIALVKEQI